MDNKREIVRLAEEIAHDGEWIIGDGLKVIHWRPTSLTTGDYMNIKRYTAKHDCHHYTLFDGDPGEYVRYDDIKHLLEPVEGLVERVQSLLGMKGVGGGGGIVHDALRAMDCLIADRKPGGYDRDVAAAEGAKRAINALAGALSTQAAWAKKAKNEMERLAGVAEERAAEVEELRRGCVCQECGETYREDVRLSDDLWNRIRPEGKPEGAGLLCGGCIGKRVATEVERLREALPYRACRDGRSCWVCPLGQYAVVRYDDDGSVESWINAEVPMRPMEEKK